MADDVKRLDSEAVAAFYDKCGNVSETARHFGVTRSSIQHHLKKSGTHNKPIAGGRRRGTIKEEQRDPPKKGVKRYILTCAQSSTHVWDPLWQNLLALREYYRAELLVSRFAYNQAAYRKITGVAANVKPGTQATEEGLWFDPRIEPHACDTRVELAPGLVFCGEMNILPTAKRPLSDLNTHTGRKSAIVPHVKHAMVSVPSNKHEPTKFTYTTGTVTMMNYLQKKAGQKAERHHAYGALLVEVDAEGSWWVRQLQAGPKGELYDAGDQASGCILASEGAVSFGHRAEAVNWGDLHVDEMDPTVRALGWGQNGMLDVLSPRYQFCHDTLSFRSRNHHDRGNPHLNFRKHVLGIDDVGAELSRTVFFLNEEASREWCKTIVVDSNHDNALGRWLREADFKTDPKNARLYLELNARVYGAIEDREPDFHLLEHALRARGLVREVRFLREDESFVVCRSYDGGIECGMHGHDGPNGAKGSPLGLSVMGRPGNTGHTHTAGIIDELWTAGTSSLLDLGYNRGPSSWSHSHIVTWPNGRRQMITMWKGKWRAAS